VRRTKIIATVGPSCAEEAMLARLLRSGMDVARLNFSHGSRTSHARAIRRIRRAAAHVGRSVGLLLDLQGPKLRVGEFLDGGVHLRQGAETLLTNRRVKGTAALIPAVYSGLMRDVKVRDRVLLDDGLIELRVLRRERRGLRCRIVVGGRLADHKGMNFPGVRLSADSLTSKDRGDLAFGLRMGIDFVALSFVRSADDILKLRRLLRRAKQPPLVIAKIERREAIENLEAILGVADGVMVARGDLGVEYPPERVPILQKRIIQRANAREVLVITATQMLESMVSSPRPTRAEASDVANAIFDGTDAVMLSAETAVGRYPDRAVRTMGRIASEAEEVSIPLLRRRTTDNPSVLASPTHALAHTAYQAAHELRAKVLAVFTHTGYSARLASKARPSSPIIALTPLESTCHRLTLAWGVTPVQVPAWRTADRMVEAGMEQLLKKKLIKRGEWVVAVAGTTTRAGGTNLLRILQVGRRPDRPKR
jgi:pyruvate kinase